MAREKRRRPENEFGSPDVLEPAPAVRRLVFRRLGWGVLLSGLSVAVQFSTPKLGSVDGYFHVRYAALVWQGGVSGFPPAFPWLPLTIRSADRYYDHHMLFHVLLAPFVAGSPVVGGKWASALFAAGALMAIYWALLRRGVWRAGWWLLAMLALAPDFLFRMEMPRVQALSLVCLLFAVEALLARRFVWLFPLAVAYTWLYDAFPFLLVIAGCLVMTVALIERRFEWRALAYPSLGITVGLVFNPYFPNDIWFIPEHYLGKAEIRAAMHVGSEWYPYAFAERTGWGGLLAMMAGAAIVVWRNRQHLNVARLALLLIGATFFCLMWRSRRFIEYAAPFVTLGLATALDAWSDRRLRSLVPAMRLPLALILMVGCGISASLVVDQMRQRPAPERYRGGAEWLANNTPDGAIIFTPDWDDFPLLFFHNQHNRYVLGLDPTYLELRDPELYRLWQRLGRGHAWPPSQSLARFNSRVALAGYTNERFIAAMASDPGMERVYQDGDCVIFRMRGSN